MTFLLVGTKSDKVFENFANFDNEGELQASPNTSSLRDEIFDTQQEGSEKQPVTPE